MAKQIEIAELKSRDRIRFGTAYPGRVFEGHHATVVVGKSIRLHGAAERPRYVDGSAERVVLQYDRTFAVGDWAEYDSYNLSFHGRITSITAKSVTIVDPDSPRRAHRLDLHDFARRNWDLDLAAARKRNAEWMD